MFVKPFALTMRLAANMTGGHIAILAILSFVFLFSEMFSSAAAGIGVGLFVSVPMATGILALENHRRSRPGLRLYTTHGRLHWYGHQRAPLIAKAHKPEDYPQWKSCTTLAPRSALD